MRESFYILREEAIISQGLLEIMLNMVGFRNVIAHDYEKIDFGIVYDVLQNKIEDIEKFVKKIETFSK